MLLPNNWIGSIARDSIGFTCPFVAQGAIVLLDMHITLLEREELGAKTLNMRNINLVKISGTKKKSHIFLVEYGEMTADEIEGLRLSSYQIMTT